MNEHNDRNSGALSIVDLGKTFFRLENGTYVEWYVEDLQWREDGVSAVLTGGDRRATVDADVLRAAIVDDSNPDWVTSIYDGEDDQGEAEWLPNITEEILEAHVDDYEIDPHYSPPISERLEILEDAEFLGVKSVQLRTAPDNPSELTFEKIEGRGSRTEVNNFLDGGHDGLVSHELGGVSSWRVAFVARYGGAIVSALTMHHYHPSTNGVEIAITRVANHPSAPHNTSTWMIARARKWAERVGYERVATYAGVGGNEGVCYRAAGFDAVGEPVDVEGKDWKGDRADETWLKQKYVYELNPEKYAGKSDEWALETVVDDVIVPGADGLEDPVTGEKHLGLDAFDVSDDRGVSA